MGKSRRTRLNPLLALFLLLVAATAADRPTVFLIGDSTVRHGRGDGAGALWGWGDFLGAHFDSNKVRVLNRALSGRSSRTFLSEGLWEKVRQELRPVSFAYSASLMSLARLADKARWTEK